MKCRNSKRQGSSFPKQRDKKFTVWLVTENDCDLRGAILTEPLTTADVRVGRYWKHRCFGDLTPAHIGKHRAKGAPDFGVTIPLDQGTHSVLDNQPEKFYRATKLTEAKLAHRAQGYSVKYVERGGIPIQGAA